MSAPSAVTSGSPCGAEATLSTTSTAPAACTLRAISAMGFICATMFEHCGTVTSRVRSAV